MQVEGKKYICERCGIEHFAEKLGHLSVGKYEDGGIFETAEGWTRQQRGVEWCDLCPACSEKLQGVIDKFWEDDVGE